MSFADALDAALDRGTYESPRVPRSTATFTSQHANPFLYSAPGASFARRHVFSPSTSSGDTIRRECHGIDDTRASASATRAATEDARSCKTGEESTRSAASVTRPRAKVQTRVLTAVERQALQVLVRHGARVMSSFSATELRREYRRLARQLHPDAHPECTATELAQLSASFAAVSSSYQILASIQD